MLSKLEKLAYIYCTALKYKRLLILLLQFPTCSLLLGMFSDNIMHREIIDLSMYRIADLVFSK